MCSGHWRGFRRVGQHIERTVLYLVHKIAPLCRSRLFDADPVSICKEVLPCRDLRVAVLPTEEIDELLLARLSTLAREHNIETVAMHDRHALLAEAFMKVALVPCMELVDAQLVHTFLAERRRV